MAPLRIREHIPQLLLAVSDQKKSEQISKEECIQVNTVVSKLSVIYEKLRNTLDAQDEHLLTKSAIVRVLRRRVAKGKKGSELARPLIVELIRASYLPNERIPESAITSVERIVNRYIHLINLVTKDYSPNQTEEFLSWAFHMMACEIEQLLVPSHVDAAILDLMEKTLAPHLTFEEALDERDRHLQILIAAMRSYMKADQSMVEYALWKSFVPEWTTSTPQYAEIVAPYIPKVREEIYRQIHHPLGDRLSRITKRYVTIFNVLKDVLTENVDATSLFTHPKMLEDAVSKQYDARLQKTHQRIRRKAGRSIMYLFLTKFLLALSLEIPFDLIWHNAIQMVPLIINITFHPALLFVISVFIRPPGKDNKKSAIQGIREVIYDIESAVFPDRLLVRKPRVSPLKILYQVIYMLVFVLVFIAIISVLDQFGFSILSGFLFILFLSLVSFFGLRIRYTAREMLVIPRRDSLLALLVDFLTLPILQLGRWLSRRFGQINVLVFVMDFLIEAPFKSFVEMTEGWFSFVREQRDAID